MTAPWDQWEVFVEESTPERGWQYALVNQGVLCDLVFGFATEAEANDAAQVALAKAIGSAP
ncbi:hypothetical protein J2738_003282 [Variovorax paradoxus]|uniref:Uncharacterized protein n=1 Tax=Variovorax paradoxus TaxID=34073 RepID=A0AAE4BYK7_VARPD|nr:hypothetical protein [Variovorax paradoxus]MDR6427144.1 hypothetical protein [Variovorax paradoxus]